LLRHSPSSATTRRALIAFAALLSLVPASQAVADSTEIISGIGVFLDDASAPGTPSVDKVGSVAPGEFIAVHIVTDIAAASPFPGASGAQFRVEIDPRFQIITKTDGDDVALSFETAPNEWDVAFTECNAGTAHLLSYYLQLPAGETDLEDLRVDVTAPAGGRMAISTCGSSARLNRAFSAGGVVLNPSTPSIVHFSRSADVLVDGRDLKLAWETSNATGVTLDGNSVAANGTAIVQPSVDTTYLLEATNGGTATEQFDVEVIRKPRVDLFTVELLPPGNAQVRVSWDIQGVEVLSLDGVGFGLGPFGDRVLPLVDPPNYEISATNEWGTTQALATLDDLNELPPSILSFAIQPANAPYGTDATMTWSVFNADQVSISPDIGVVDPDQGLLFIPVESDQSYTITATNGNGSDVDMATLTVATPVIEEFFSSNETPIPGSSIDLVWDVVGAQTLEIQPDVGFVDLPSGSVTVTPQSASTTYVLIANSPGGMVQRAVDINWSPPFVALSTSTPVVFGGTEVDIEVTIFGADTATLTPEPGALIPPVSQTIPVVVDETTLFTLTAENVAGTRTVAFLVSAQQPEAELEASQTLVPAGTTVTLTATIDGAQSAVISPDLGVIDPAGGSFDVVVDTSTLFQLHATNPTGTTTVGVEVLVEGEVPVIHSFEADPASIVELQSSTLSWDVSGATQIEILPGGYTTTDLQGSLEVTPSTDTTYRLIASSPFLTVESTVTVEVEENDLGVVYFEADPQLIAEGETANLLWFVLDADEVTIEPGGFTSTAGLGVLEVSPTETTEYPLTASKGPVSIQATTTITVAPFRVISFEVSPLVFLPGESVTVSWGVVGTADVSVDGFGPQPLVGSFEDTPTGETTYTLRVQNGAAIAVRQETVIPGTEQFPSGIVMSFTPDGSQWQGELPFGVPTTVYAVLVGSYWDGVLGVDYGLDAHPSIVVLSEELLIPGSTDDGLGAQEMVLELPQCVLTEEPVDFHPINEHRWAVRGERRRRIRTAGKAGGATPRSADP